MTDKFHTELKNLKAETLEMAHLGRFMLRTAVDALIRQDNELAASVVARKEKIHEMEVRIEEHCYHLIALNQPMAKDMRTIACTLKVITASLRIGRYGKVIAKIVEKISDQPHLANLMTIPHMADLVTEMIDDSIEAYERLCHSNFRFLPSGRHHRFTASVNLPRRHHVHDGRSKEYHALHQLYPRGPLLEACADHACKIAENVHYMNTGERIEIH